ncbi:MAG: hypothetical protein GYA48_14485 [Chloroflexi bacterium]|nr:hypothetical protein [Chloroflexota bacterium]
MFTRLSQALDRLAARSNMIVFGLLFLITFFIFIPSSTRRIEQASGQPADLLDMRLAYTPAQAQSLFDALGEAGRDAYAHFSMSADLVFPLVYGLLFSTGLVYLYRPSLLEHPARFSPVFLPLLAMLFDYLENFTLVACLANYPTPDPLMLLAASLFTTTKWVFQTATFAAAAWGLYQLLRSRRAARR